MTRGICAIHRYYEPLRTFVLASRLNPWNFEFSRAREEFKVPVQLPLGDDITDAILKHKGIGGDALKCVFSYERWDTESISFGNIDRSDIGNTYIESIAWATKVMSNV